MLFDQQTPKLLNVGRTIFGQHVGLQLPPVIDHLLQAKLFDQAPFLTTVSHTVRLASQMIPDRPFGYAQPMSDRPVGFTFVFENLPPTFMRDAFNGELTVNVRDFIAALDQVMGLIHQYKARGRR